MDEPRTAAGRAHHDDAWAGKADTDHEVHREQCPGCKRIARIEREAAEAARAEVAEPGDDVYAWLIERGTSYGTATPTYLLGPEPDRWTSDAHKAWRFATRAEAESVIRRNSAGGAPFGEAVEHGFIAGPLAECPYCGLGRAHDPRCRMAEVAEPGDGPNECPVCRATYTLQQINDAAWRAHNEDVHNAPGLAATAGREPLDALREALDTKPYEWLDEYSGAKGWEAAMDHVRATLDTPDPGASS